jgi:phage tail sheath gpL-like
MPINTLQRPSITLNIQNAELINTDLTRRVLLIGEVGNNSTVETNKIKKDVKLEDLDIFGDGLLSLAISKYKEINKFTVLDILPLDLGDSKSSSSIKVNDSVTKNSMLTIKLDKYQFQVPLIVGDDNIAIAQKIENAFNEHEILSKLFEVTRTDNELDFESKIESAYYNRNKFELTEDFKSGLVYDVTMFDDGLSKELDPEFLNDLNIDERYTSIIFEINNGTKAVTNYLEKVFNLTNQIKDGVGFATFSDKLSNAIDKGNELNYKTLVLFSNLDEMNYNIFNLVATAEIVAIRELRLTNNTNISNYVLSNVETFGNISFATYPYFNTPLSFDKPKGCIKEEDLINLLNSGVTTFINNGKTVLSEVVTTYKYNTLGEKDNSFKYLNYVDTMSVIREFFVTQLRNKYAQYRLTDGDLLQGYNITNKGAIKATLLKLYSLLANMAITRKGLEKYFSSNTTIIDDLELGRVVINCKTPIVTQLRAIDGNIIEVLNINVSI